MNKIYGAASSAFLISLLTACGGSGSSKIEEIANRAPTAKIVIDASTITLDDSVAISGTTSTDLDGDELTYKWIVEDSAGEAYKLENNIAESFQFTPTQYGTYKVNLVVSDTKLSSKSVSSKIVVEPNQASYPVAKVTGHKVSKIGSVNWFTAEDSSASEGQNLTYNWSLKSKPMQSKSVISDVNKPKGFVTPDVTGVYTVLLTVTNAENKLTATQEILLIADEVLTNSEPVAVISTPLPGYIPKQKITLNATDSFDLDGAALTYQWTLNVPSTAHNVALANDTTEFVDFTVDGIGEYVITLEVSDGVLKHQVSQTITVTDINIAPVAIGNMDDEQETDYWKGLELNGLSSVDPDGKTSDLIYHWSLISKPQSSTYFIEEAGFRSDSKFTFFPDIKGHFVLGLQAFDGTDYSVIDHLHIEILSNSVPVAVLPDDVIINHSGAVSLQNTQSYDPEGEELTYKWKVIKTPTDSQARILSYDDRDDLILMTDLPGTYTVELIVNDGELNSIPAYMNFVFIPEDHHEVTVKGKLVDETGTPLKVAKIGGIFHVKLPSEDNGNFEVVLYSKTKNALLTVLHFIDDSIPVTTLRIPETDETTIDVGTLTLPTMQERMISLVACEGYTGEETMPVLFYLNRDGYENMSFPKPVAVELSLNQEPIAVQLPVSGLIDFHLTIVTTREVYIGDKKKSFTHQLKTDDMPIEPLEITLCNK